MVHATLRRNANAKRLSIAQQQSDFTSEGAPLPRETPPPVPVGTRRPAKAVSSTEDTVPKPHGDGLSSEDR
jgi:hypothetical protein